MPCLFQLLFWPTPPILTTSIGSLKLYLRLKMSTEINVFVLLNSYYRWNIYVSPNMYVQMLTSCVMVWGGAWVRVWSPLNGAAVLVNEALPHSQLLLPVRTLRSCSLRSAGALHHSATKLASQSWASRFQSSAKSVRVVTGHPVSAFVTAA
ncbi:hypothetical protein HJG60_009946 [Phyllostomus discolor]|uniref:Uncharacterized protein n=1 Tax=Phyllostomus discolor TaxID=89673 RepID=A0A834B777_9CHIR|nr:hypothetical protein HJG60_009946 [Phyllostomus discolor]